MPDKFLKNVKNSRIYQPTQDVIYYYQPPVDEQGSHDYFGYPVYDDPQDIPDEKFFGAWDAKNGTWIVEPYFVYERYPNMEKIMNAAKEGNYAAAKEALLQYYQEIAKKRWKKKASSKVSATAEAKLEALSRNIFSYSLISSLAVGGFEVPENEFTPITVPIYDYILEDAKGAYAELSFEIASGDKFWTTAEIYSKEAEWAEARPYLSAVVNGIYTEFPVSKDTMVVGGSCGNHNYGTDPVIYVEEHGTYDNIDASYGSYSDTTKRMFIAFDICSLGKKDKIADVQLHLTARNVISEETKMRFSDQNGNPLRREADRSKYLWITWYKDSAWQEDTLSWNTTNILDKMYFSCNDMEAWDYVTDKSPRIKGKVCDFHRNIHQKDLCLAYQAAKDERYAYTYIRQAMALIHSIGCNTEVMNALDMSVYASGLVNSFFAFLDSVYFTPEVCTAWLKFLWQLSDWMVEDYYGTAKNNWGTFATGAVYETLAGFEEFTAHDHWYAETKRENTRILLGTTLDDGLCIEQSHNYIHTILQTYNSALETHRVTGHAGPYEDVIYKNIYDTVKSLVFTSGPYFGGFNQGDGYDPYTSYLGTFQLWYENLYSEDENLAWLVSGGTKGNMPQNPTTVYPLSHKTFMRSGWDEKSLQLAFINVTDSRRSHTHYDALSCAMFAYGSYLLVDPGYGGDQTGDEGKIWQYNKSPVQHNLVTINDSYDYLYDKVCAATTIASDSSGARDFESNEYYDYQEYYNTGYSSSRLMQRSITFLKEQKFWIVSDYCVPNDSTAENEFAQHWHTYPNANMEHDEKLVVRTNYDGPNVIIVPVESEELDGVDWVDCYYSEKTGMKVMAQKAMYTKTHTGAGRFTTLIIPEDVNEHFKVVSATIANGSGVEDSLINGARFTITEENTGEASEYLYYHINDAAGKPKDGVIIDRYVTDANTLVVQTDRNHEMVSWFVVQGTYVKDVVTGQYLYEADAPATASYRKEKDDKGTR